MDKMIGRKAPVGPGGRACACCKVAPGKARKAEKRAVKRSERNGWKREVAA